MVNKIVAITVGKCGVYVVLACEQCMLLQLQTCRTIRKCHVCTQSVWQKLADVFLMVTSMTMLDVSMTSLRAHCTCVVQPEGT